MNTPSTTARTRTTAVRMQRLLAVLSLTIALVAIPAFSPDGASAMRMSEGSARRACFNAGGSMHYEFYGSGFWNYNMSCTLPSGASFDCFSMGNALECY